MYRAPHDFIGLGSTFPEPSKLDQLDPLQNQLCRVCDEPAAGFHFGAFTCEGCKSFFGRTCNNQSVIQECKNNYRCVVDKKNRTACKACRLRKCLMVGMSKSGSRYGRRSNWFKIHCLMQQGGPTRPQPPPLSQVPPSTVERRMPASIPWPPRPPTSTPTSNDMRDLHRSPPSDMRELLTSRPPSGDLRDLLASRPPSTDMRDLLTTRPPTSDMRDILASRPPSSDMSSLLTPRTQTTDIRELLTRPPSNDIRDILLSRPALGGNQVVDLLKACPPPPNMLSPPVFAPLLTPHGEPKELPNSRSPSPLNISTSTDASSNSTKSSQSPQHEQANSATKPLSLSDFPINTSDFASNYLRLGSFPSPLSSIYNFHSPISSSFPLTRLSPLLAANPLFANPHLLFGQKSYIEILQEHRKLLESFGNSARQTSTPPEDSIAEPSSPEPVSPEPASPEPMRKTDSPIDLTCRLPSDNETCDE